MLQLGSIYLIVIDMEKSISFYSELLEMEPTNRNFDRWVQFDFAGHCIALFNPKYDEKMMLNGDNIENTYSKEYIKYQNETKIKYGNNVVLNFYVEDLNKEYTRLKKLNIGKMTEIMFLNFAMPYYFFVINDPDGNRIEITG